MTRNLTDSVKVVGGGRKLKMFALRGTDDAEFFYRLQGWRMIQLLYKVSDSLSRYYDLPNHCLIHPLPMPCSEWYAYAVGLTTSGGLHLSRSLVYCDDRGSARYSRE